MNARSASPSCGVEVRGAVSSPTSTSLKKAVLASTIRLGGSRAPLNECARTRHQSPAGIQAVPPVAGQYVEQIPVKTTHATRGPNSAWQSVSLLQVRQSCAAPRVKSAQKPAFPVVNVQWVLALLALQVLSLPVVQIFKTGVQMLVLCAIHRL